MQTRKSLARLAAVSVLLAPLGVLPTQARAESCVGADVTAKVVALDQVLVYNRLGAFNPAGMMFALASDVFPKGTLPANETLANSCAANSCSAGDVQLRSSKRPRPLTLRANEQQTLCIEFTNLLNPVDITDAGNVTAGVGVPPLQSEQPATRNVGVHIQGMQWVNGPEDDGSNAGKNGDGLAAPGHSRVYSYFAEKDGAYVITSGPNVGGEGNSGAIASGLFGIMNVEPPQSEWYRSQVTREEMVMAADANGNGVLDPTEQTAGGQPILNYDATYPAGHPYAGWPILRITRNGEIVHNDLHAVITGPARGGVVGDKAPFEVYPDRGEAFREFSVVFHDEVKVVQAFPGWFEPLQFTLGSVKDGFAINYGTGGIGSEIIANRLGVGPMKDCVECKYEEFFLTSWTVGDPAMIVDVPANAGLETCDPGLNNCDALGAKATKAFFPDDPSNVAHSYLNDRTKIRNVHVGTEHHIFHLHAHQWLFAPKDDNSNYLDAQAIGPGSSFTYEIAYGGAGNRNKTVGDSIFHCHFYPHFAQGMWAFWRVHDTFEIGSLMNPDGTVAERGLVDGEIPGGGYDAMGNPIAGGTPVPGLVPIPAKGMAPMPGTYAVDVDGDGVDDPPFMGYPFYIAGEAGHRPPTAPLDLVVDGGIPRHIITGGTAHAVQTATDFDKVLLAVTGHEVPEDGTVAEKVAMAFHGPQPGGVTHPTYNPDGTGSTFEVNGAPPVAGAPYAEPCRPVDGWNGSHRTYRASVIELDAKLNKVGWHFGQERIIVLDDDVDATLDGTRAPEPFVMRANTRDCVDFDHTNLVPNIYQLDDFQVRTPTDVIGQHIHLVKFDVMSADGAGNGWNYEDGTLSPDEIAERIHALEAPGGHWTGSPLGVPGPRTTRQRWFVDTGWRGNVFTHDHFGPSTHQQAGLYATMLVEPEGSEWRDPTTGEAMGTRVSDGGPTSWRADIITADESYREFYLEFADYQLAYRSPEGDGAGILNGPNQPVNPSDRQEVPLPVVELPNLVTCGAGACRPEAISSRDPGTYVVNYRNEPLALRLRDPADNRQAKGNAGDLGFAFSSLVSRADARLNLPPEQWPYGVQTATEGALAGDPFTPLLRGYEGDKIHLRVQVGAHEEGHNFTMNGVRWLQQWNSGYSGFRNSQMAGLSEYFIFELPSLGSVKGSSANGFEDYLYQTGASVDARWNGSWGLMRAYNGTRDGLLPLPSNPKGKAPPMDGRLFSGICPKETSGRNARNYKVVAVQAQDVLPAGAIVYNGNTGALGAGMEGPLNDPTGLMYVLDSDLDKKSGKLKANRRVEPLVIRANAGECINITLENRLPATLHGPDPAFPVNETADLAGYNIWPMVVNEFNANRLRPSSEVGLHAQLVEYDMYDSDGMNVGQNPKLSGTTILTTAGPGETVKYQWYAGQIQTDVETGTRTAVPTEFGAINLMAADPLKGSNKGLIGALIIEPPGSSWPVDGEPGTDGLLTRAAVTVTRADGSNFRDLVAMYQDDVNFRFADGSVVPPAIQEFEPENSGHKGLNYRSEPLWFRLGIDPNAGEEDPDTRLADFTEAFANIGGQDPVTPVFTAAAGQEARFRVLKPGGHTRNNVFTLHGHLWANAPYNADSTAIDRDNQTTFWRGEQMGHGPSNHFEAIPLHGAGGKNQVAGDYLYRDMAPVHVYQGEWGLFRVE